MTKRTVSFSTDPWALTEPFTITGYTFTEVRPIYVEITEGNFTGRGEGTGVYYLEETAERMLAQAEGIKEAIENGLDREELQTLLPAGGARNAIDCALWDLEAKKTGKSIWDLTGVEQKETITVNTVGINSEEKMAATAKKLDTPKIKVKLSGERPLERIKAVVEARPDAEIVVDVNQGWTFDQLVDLAPKFKELGIAMLEQPLQRGNDAELEDYVSPIPLCADESCLHTGEFEQAAKRYQMINIKLDKTGGLTEALKLAKMAQEKGLGLMVGNMTGTSVAMAPSFVVAQMCQFVDLDGPIFLTDDRENAMTFTNGKVSTPTPELWG